MIGRFTSKIRNWWPPATWLLGLISNASTGTGDTHGSPCGSSWTCKERYQTWEWNESLKMSPSTSRYPYTFLAQAFMGYRAQRATYCRMWSSFKSLRASPGKDLSDMEMPLEWRVGDSKGDETKYFYADSSKQQWGSRLQTRDALWAEQTGSQVNSLTNMSNDWAHVQPVKLKVEAQAHQNKHSLTRTND